MLILIAIDCGVWVLNGLLYFLAGNFQAFQVQRRVRQQRRDSTSAIGVARVIIRIVVHTGQLYTAL